MKVKYLAAACAALCSVSAFAATYDPATTTPAKTVYIAGASAQKNALLATVPSTVFSTAAHGVLFVNGPNGSVGWLGDDKLGGITLVIYNSTNGSAAGLNQLISAGTPEAEATVLALPAAGCTAKVAVAPPNIATEQTTCTSTSAAREADMALSDVYATEFEPGYLSTGSSLKSASTSASTGLEGFGVITNAVLYDALVAQNIHDGLLPASCASATAATLTVGTGNGACQPSVRSADYASLVTSAGQFNDYTSLVKDQGAKEITVCRRDHLSGTQAAANIFFLNAVCGELGYQGALAPAISGDTNTGTYVVVDEANNATDLAENCVWSGSAAGTSAYPGYAAGVVSLGEKDSVDAVTPQSKHTSDKYYFVKLDGVSPNYTAAGAYDSLHRSNLVTGAYKFATEMAAYVKSATSLTSGNGKVAASIANDIANANLSSVTGIAYLTGGTFGDGKTARYSKGGNNCSVYQ